MKEFLEFIIRQLVEFPDDMVLTEIPGRMTVFKVQLRQSDVTARPSTPSAQCSTAPPRGMVNAPRSRSSNKFLL
jgi:hypothetical protein